MTPSNGISVTPEGKGWGLLSERTIAVVLGALLVTLNLGGVAVVLNHQQALDAQRSDIARERVELAGERGKIEEATARNSSAGAHLAEISRQIDTQTLAMDRQRIEQRDLDQRKRERDDAIAGRDEARQAQRDAEVARDKAQVDARAASASLASARDTLQALQSESGRLNSMKSGLQADIDRLQRDKQSADAALRKADDDRKSADALTQQAMQGRDEARRVVELAQRDRDSARDAAASAKADLTSLEARRADATSALQRLTERRQAATTDAEAEEARLKKASDALIVQQTALSNGQQREDDLRKRLQVTQTSAADAETRRLATLQELGNLQGQFGQVQAQLTAAKADQTRLVTLQTQIGSATQQLGALQQQQTTLHADIQSLQSQKVELTKAQADADALRAEIRSLTAARNQLNLDLGQRAQLDQELKALNQSIGKLRMEADQAATDRQKALDDRAVFDRERKYLVGQLPTLRSQQDALQKELDATVEKAAQAQAALGSTLRARDAAEQDVVRLRALAAGLAAQTLPNTIRGKQETP